MDKSTLRKKALSDRLALSESMRQALSEKLLEAFKSLDFSKLKAIHIFLPIIAKNEPNTFLFIDWIKEHYPDIKILIPVSNFADHSMQSHLYSGPHELEINAYGIPEPKHIHLVDIIPDMVLVPLLAFDQRGYRIGYGKGFYDRYLGKMDTFKLGISFFPASNDIKDVHLNDIKLDACLCPDGLIFFNNLNHG